MYNIVSIISSLRVSFTINILNSFNSRENLSRAKKSSFIYEWRRGRFHGSDRGRCHRPMQAAAAAAHPGIVSNVIASAARAPYLVGDEFPACTSMSRIPKATFLSRNLFHTPLVKLNCGKERSKNSKKIAMRFSDFKFFWLFKVKKSKFLQNFFLEYFVYVLSFR